MKKSVTFGCSIDEGPGVDDHRQKTIATPSLRGSQEGQQNKYEDLRGCGHADEAYLSVRRGKVRHESNVTQTEYSPSKHY